MAQTVARDAAGSARTDLADLLGAWMPRQRWFAGKGATSDGVHPLAAVDLPLPPPAAGDGIADKGVLLRLHLIRLAGALYQVPLTHRRRQAPELAHALIGTLDGQWVYDGPHDPLFVRALARAIALDEQLGDPTALVVHGVRQDDGFPITETAPAAVLRGEQSNTSIILGAGTPYAVIIKLFRVIHPGENPDVVVQSALAGVGCTRVPRPAGRLEVEWREPAASQQPEHDPNQPPDQDGATRHRGHLAFASEFVDGGRDGWRLALDALAAGAPFDEPARALGRATAEVHRLLAATLPTRAVTGEELKRLAADLHRRVTWACTQVPALAAAAEPAHAAVERMLEATSAGELQLQRVHGDYHLGQVLYAPGRGWVLLDFEGEPLRPLAERLEPDLALRDVAGMLRSFDYAAGHARLTAGTTGAADPTGDGLRAWAGAARTAFLAGYAEGHGTPPEAAEALRGVLELDKALYEVVYETRNRPDWVPIPMDAVRHLLD